MLHVYIRFQTVETDKRQTNKIESMTKNGNQKFWALNATLKKKSF